MSNPIQYTGMIIDWRIKLRVERRTATGKTSACRTGKTCETRELVHDLDPDAGQGGDAEEGADY